MWEYTLSHLEDDPLKLDRELDWVIKYKLIEAYRSVTTSPSAMPGSRSSTCSITTSTASEASSIGCSARAWSTASSPTKRSHAVEHPPQTTRARLRGRVHQAGQERKRDYTVDWVHLKLNDQAQRTVLCKDPFKAEDERVDKLIASL